MDGAGAVAACRVVGVWVLRLVCLGFGELVQAPLHMGPHQGMSHAIYISDKCTCCETVVLLKVLTLQTKCLGVSLAWVVAIAGICFYVCVHGGDSQSCMTAAALPTAAPEGDMGSREASLTAGTCT